MAKARVNLKGVSRAVDRLTKDLKNLRKSPTTARKMETAALHRKLTAVKTLLTECPKTMFSMFEVAAPARARRKTTRKRTRKAR